MPDVITPSVVFDSNVNVDIRDTSELPPRVTSAIKTMRVRTITSGASKNNRTVSYLTIELYDKVAALRQLGLMLGPKETEEESLKKMSKQEIWAKIQENFKFIIEQEGKHGIRSS